MNQKYTDFFAKLGIPVSAVEDAFSLITITRGIKYFEQGRVFFANYDTDSEDEITIDAEVYGSGSTRYETYVTLNLFNNALEIHSDCDCPVGYQCKHGVATLCEFVKDADNLAPLDVPAITSLSAEEIVDDWLDGLQLSENDHNRENDTTPTSNSSQQLLYLLSSSQESGALEVETVKAKLLKRGGYGKSRPQAVDEISESAGLFYNRSININPLDVEIASLLNSLPDTEHFYARNNYTLQGDIGQFTLNKLLESKRCFWQTQEDNQPLSTGMERLLELEWQQIDKHYQVSSVAKPTAHELFKLNHFYYLDLHYRQIGQLTAPDLNDEQIYQLLTAPPIPFDMAKKVSQKLLQIWPDSDVPMPFDMGIKNIPVNVHQPGVDVLLHSTEITHSGLNSGKVEEKTRVHLLSLRFNYAGHIIQPTENKKTYTLLEDNKRYKITRNNFFEEQTLITLGKSQFIALEKLGVEHQNPLDLTLVAESQANIIALWHEFQSLKLPELEAQGWQFHIDESFQLQVVDSGDWFADVQESETNDWFEMSLGIELNGEKVNLLPSLVALLSNQSTPQQLQEKLQAEDFILLPVQQSNQKTTWVKLPSSRVTSIFDTLVELYENEALNSHGSLSFNKQQGLQFGDLLNDPSLKWKGAEDLQHLSQKLHDFAGIQAVPLPKNLQAELRDYQQQGLNWLQFLREYQFNGILADDMGLGKTVQALTHLLYEKQQHNEHKASLVIAPTSLMGNWRREAKRFTPDLKVLVLYGLERQKDYEKIPDYDIVLTTYALSLRDQPVHLQHHYHYIVLDEAQNIKNAKSKTAQAIFQLKSNYRLCLTGTPMENHLGELWSLFHFLMPGYLGSHEYFKKLFATPIEKEGDGARQKQLRKRIQPFMLRRTKEMVATELPAKTEIIRTIPLSGKQRDLYETVRLAMDKKVQQEIGKKGLARSQIMILDALLKLRQTCCDPRLLSLDMAKNINVSVKLEMLMEMLPEMIEEGRKIIIFSQFVKMLSLIEEELSKEKIRYSKLTGQTRKRDEAIQAFQEGDAQVFLISLKAGGVGLNLTAADTVIHYDPWWNPAVEKQATDRAYRIGQDKPVFVYKLLSEETVEEKILQMQHKKQVLADGLYSDNVQKKGPMFSSDDLMALLQPLE